MYVFHAHAQNTNLSDEIDFNGEPFLAINPTNPQHLITAWMGFNGLNLIQIQTRTSFDGGSSWSPVYKFPHLSGYNTSADPSIAFNSDGDVFICFIDYAIDASAGGVYIYKSDDGGLSFLDPVEAINVLDDPDKAPVDRPWMVIDKSGGDTDGNIYITTKPAPWILPPNRNYFVASTDGGLTFSAWKHLDVPGWSIGNFIAAPMATPAVSNDGTFYAVYPSFEITENIYPRFICAKSTDAGETFTHTLVKEGTALSNDTILKLGYLLLTDDNDPAHLALLNILTDYGDEDILLNESFDGGVTWSENIRVNDDEPAIGVQQDLVWADFDASGNLLVTWRDRRNAGDAGSSTSYEIYGAVKWKDSLQFSQNFNISDALVAFDDVLKENGNDFMSCVFYADTLYATWGDTRDGNLDIWFAKLDTKTQSGVFITELSEPEKIILSPNPVNMNGYMEFSKYDETGMPCSIYDAAGNLVFNMVLSPGEKISPVVFTKSSGTFYFVVTTQKKVSSGIFEVFR
jgi:hypothetical protein